MNPNHRPMPRFARRLLALCLASALLPQLASAADADPFLDLNLKEVLGLEITSVSKKPQTISQAAAAVHVITSDDIRRSGAATIAEALRLAPGLQVAQLSASAWAIGARGLTGRFANKLLVLMDGRSVYTPTFSGVYWDVQDTVLADIDRIEVIRGPGASLWGSNAVSGVINIITKSAAATQGTQVWAAAGDEERGLGAARVGGRLGELGHWRAYAKAFERDGSVLQDSGTDGNDNWRQQRMGWRADLTPGAGHSVTVQGDLYRGHSNESTVFNRLTPPYKSVAPSRQQVSGWNMLGRWQHDLSQTDSFTLQATLDDTDRDWPAHLDESRQSFDLDFQYRTRRQPGHDLVFGAGWRHSRDRTSPADTGPASGALPYATLQPQSARRSLASLFVQDDITLRERELILTLGAKLEKPDDAGWKVQPNLRLLWTAKEDTTLWASAARAVRTPSRIDRDGQVIQTVFAPGSQDNPLPLPVVLQTRGTAGTETMVAYEVGWKQRVSPTVSVDLALFSNRFSHLRTVGYAELSCQPSGALVSAGCFMMPRQTHAVQWVRAANDAEGRSHGFELAATWRALQQLRIDFSVAQVKTRIVELPGQGTTDREKGAPERQWGLRAAWTPRADLDFNLQWRRVGRLEEPAVGMSIPAYAELDLRLAWRPTSALELAVVGRNLLDKRHAETASELLDLPQMQIQRAWQAQLSWKF